MTEPPATAVVQPGVFGALTDIGRTVVGALPPAFLMLCMINAAFLYFVLRFVEHQADARAALVTRIVDNCLAK